MLLKLGVDISRLAYYTRKSLNTVETVFLQHGIEPVLTETYGSVHSCGSLHYAHRAYDLRLPVVNKDKIVAELKDALGRKFDVILEATHIHVEYDPKEERK